MDSARRLVRLVFYPAAIALAAFAWHEDRPSDDASVGVTTQGERISAIVRNSRLVAFETHLQCTHDGGFAPMRVHWKGTVPAVGSDGVPTFNDGRTVWQMTWRPALGPRNTIVRRGSTAPANNRPRASGGATSIVTASVADGTLSGTLLTSIALQRPDGSFATCAVSGVRFSLPS
jgi:hypothetical protein